MNDCAARLQKMVRNDTDGMAKRTLRIMQSDVCALLCEFMDVTKLDVAAERTEQGYTVKITAQAARLYDVGHTTDAD